MSNILTIRHPPWRLTLGRFVLRIRFVALCLVALALSGVLPASAGADATSGRLSGLIEDDKGTVLPGSQLRLTDATGTTTATANEQGRYSASVPPGLYDITVSAHAQDGPPLEAKVREVEVGEDSRLNLVLAGQPIQTATLTGTLRDAAGVPISAAHVSAGAQTVTDNEGAFVLEVPSGRYGLAVDLLWGSGAVNAWVEDFDLSQDRRVDLTLPLISIDVSVRNEAGSALGGAEVSVSSGENCLLCPASFELFPGASTRQHFHAKGETHADGQVRLAALPTSSLSLSARIPDSTSYRSVQRTGLTAKASKTFDVVLPTRWHAAGSISAAASPVTFSGSLRDVGGMLTPDRTSVNLYRGGTVVGNPSFDDDTFAVSAPPGSYTLRVEATSLYDSDEPEWRPDRDVVGLSVDPFELQTDRHEDLRLPLVPFPVRVLDHAGEPVPGAWVESLGNGGTSGELFSGAQTTGYFRSDRWTDANGETTLRVLPGMAVTVRVDPPGGRGLPAEVELPSTATSAEVPLADAPTLRGRISTADGQPVRPQHGSLRPESGGPERSFTVAEDGTYAVSALLGRYRMALDTEAHFYRPSENAAFWHLSSSPFELSGDTNLDITIPRDGYGGERGQVSAVNAEGWSMGDGFGDNVHGESIGDFELAPGVRATSTFSIFAPEGGWGSRRLPILVPSRLSTRLPWNSAVELPALYVAPGERTVVAQVVGSTLPTPVAPGEIGGRADGEDSATVTWSPSERDFGSPVLGYLVSPDHGRSVYVKTPATTAVLTGLSPGTTYRFSVAAVSRRGIGEARGGDPIVTSGTRPVPQVTTTPVVPPAPLPSPTTTVLDGPPAARSGYWMVGSDGRVYPFGDAKHLGEPVNELGSADVVDLESTHSGDGYWVLDERGRVFAYGDAVKLGDATLAVGEQATSLSATSSGSGYWVFTNTGRVIRFGDTQHYGDMAGVRLNGPVLDSVATPSGKGYYMVASDGGVFTFGDAHFAGSMGGKKLNAPVQSLVPDGDGHGYWLVASDGGVFAFGAPFSGSMAGTRLNRPVTGMVRFGNGYLMVGQDGGVFSFSDRQFHGSLGDKPPANPVVSVAVLP